MRIEQLQYSGAKGWSALDTGRRAPAAQLVLVFGDTSSLTSGAFLPPLRKRFPDAAIVSCSTGGAILGSHVVTGGVTATAVHFERAGAKVVGGRLARAEDSERVAAALARELPAEGLRHVLVFAEGLGVNGSALARGFTSALPDGVLVSGGLAADGERFETTLVGLDATPSRETVVAIGLYGDDLVIGTGSYGGWEAFGLDRRITRSEGNVLYELDGRPALQLYKELLGRLGHALPASGLLFPLTVRASDEERGVVRTILGIDERAGSLTFAGDVPQGWIARLMRTDLDQLIEAAGSAAAKTRNGANGDGHTLAVAVSCIGRMMLLQRRVDEELASVLNVLGPETSLAGFYSYGELAPSGAFAKCELHNQTMTLTTIGE